MLSGWRSRRRCITTIRLLRRLKLDTILLTAVIALVAAIAVIAMVCWCSAGRVRWSGLVVAIIRLSILTGSRGPASAVEGPLASFTTATSGDAAAQNED